MIIKEPPILALAESYVPIDPKHASQLIGSFGRRDAISI